MDTQKALLLFNQVSCVDTDRDAEHDAVNACEAGIAARTYPGTRVFDQRRFAVGLSVGIAPF